MHFQAVPNLISNANNQDKPSNTVIDLTMKPTTETNPSQPTTKNQEINNLVAMTFTALLKQQLILSSSPSQNLDPSPKPSSLNLGSNSVVSFGEKGSEGPSLVLLQWRNVT